MLTTLNPPNLGVENEVQIDIDGNVWVINRSNNLFYILTDAGATQFNVELDEMYGAALLESGMILAGDQGNQLRVVDPATLAATEASFELPFEITAGDLAGGCGDNYEGIEEPAENVASVSDVLTAFTAYPNPTEGIMRYLPLLLKESLWKSST